ncbi:PREDICTED: probable pectin methyltransferase QUA2 isoform X2 [Camelina sativa]|uniref:Methyltransferase n=1 Tax=Camelina sativa TaxID=90675 RepID=A0ABM0SVN5_CAMSA|nr:PREDICTED: probable pectin methyltransferase QUA2 isoform X1 [Camelina sativa]XP_010416802.1 PREDICTED: probable pectin methyltransferase QUA2 isoform X2 [Camelina sativa]
MSMPLQRGISGVRVSDSSDDLRDSQMKDKTDKEDLIRGRSTTDSHLTLRFPFAFLFTSSNHKHGGDNAFPPDPYTARTRHRLMLMFLKISLVLIVVFALAGSFWWTISISTSSRGHVYHNYRRLQEQLVSDLLDIEEISLGPNRWKDLDYCNINVSENFVPCFNASENLALGYSNGDEIDRFCGPGSKQECLVLPPVKYRVPLRWPTGKDVIWLANVKISAQEVVSSGSITKRMMMMEDDQISFRSASLMSDEVEDYSHQIAQMIGIKNDNFIEAGVRTILDIGCGYGSFGAHLLSKQLLTMCIANYEASGSQVQLTLERGLPAMIGSFISKQLPYPSLSFDMLHCLRCGIDWDQKDGLLLVEVDRVLKPGGYFVWTSPLTNARSKENLKRWNFIHDFAESICWTILPQQDETVVWRKTIKTKCYSSRKPGVGPSVCTKGHDVESPYYRPLQMCIGGTRSRRWIPIEGRTRWPSRSNMNKTELSLYGLHPEVLGEDAENWKITVREYWSLLSPLIFSDHPKRPGDEDPSPPYNMLRNVLDMNAQYGGLNSALLEAKKSVWVMNVVPTAGPNHLPMILDRGLVGVLHDWCEPFPTYPRTYDLVHADNLLSLQTTQRRRSPCSLMAIFTEIDRLLRPEGWVIIRDTALLVEKARAMITQLKWEARVIEVESSSEQRLLICQKPLTKRQQSL